MTKGPPFSPAKLLAKQTDRRAATLNRLGRDLAHLVRELGHAARSNRHRLERARMHEHVVDQARDLRPAADVEALQRIAHACALRGDAVARGGAGGATAAFARLGGWRAGMAWVELLCLGCGGGRMRTTTTLLVRVLKKSVGGRGMAQGCGMGVASVSVRRSGRYGVGVGFVDH